MPPNSGGVAGLGWRRHGGRGGVAKMAEMAEFGGFLSAPTCVPPKAYLQNLLCLRNSRTPPHPVAAATPPLPAVRTRTHRDEPRQAQTAATSPGNA
ncbi:hypothetical protein D0Y65_004216 [Glycine soja]|uniref:Uncharacterized protein n=1 Tax=Glycine soja TaxID=3848 RepID=A0A445LQA3_GLYSO|nr:hypothetical protein D0Y65_004216 [Glycine soja]